MSGALPTSPAFRSLSVSDRRFNVSSESVSGRTQVRSLGGQRWQLTAVYPPLTRSEFAPVMAFIVSQGGMLGTFTVTPTVLKTSSGSASGSVTTSGSAAIGATSLSVTGLTGSLKAGDFIKFAGHTKVYMLTADRSGNGSISFSPALVGAVANGEAVTYTNVPFTVRLAADVQEFPASTDVTFRYEIDMIEVV